jgi:hypothetical protein
MKLTEIARGWYNFVTASAEHKQMIDSRLTICDECPEKKQIGTTGKRILHAINNKASIYYCGQCNCPLASKTAAPEATCPLNKWISLNQQSYY